MSTATPPKPRATPRPKSSPAKGSAARGGKTTGQTAGKPAKIPQPHGGALNAGGTPGNKGGRPTNEHLAWCRSAVDDPQAREQVLNILRDKDHPAFATMWKTLAERGHGKPVQAMEHAGADGGAIRHEVTITRRIVDPAPPEHGDRGQP